jgi:hypothetical protein
MPIILEDENGENGTRWKATATKDELQAYFKGATGALRKKEDNSAVFPDQDGVFQLEDGVTYKVLLSGPTPKGTI